MPAVVGIYTSKELRQRGIDLPILMLTALDAIDDRVSGLDAGVVPAGDRVLGRDVAGRTPTYDWKGLTTTRDCRPHRQICKWHCGRFFNLALSGLHREGNHSSGDEHEHVESCGHS